MNAQEGYIRQLCEIQRQFRGVPILCAGDVLHRWNASPEIVNLLIRTLPEMYAVPGQHDLPNHSYDQIYRSAYWTLVESGVVINLDYDITIVTPSKIALHGFPWGSELRPLGAKMSDEFHIAVVHKYVWHGGAKHDRVREEDHSGIVLRELNGYDSVLFGDNHKPWSYNTAPFFNCGSFMRRHADEREHHPSVGLVYSDGTVRRLYLDVSLDKWREAPEPESEIPPLVDTEGVVEELSRLEIKLTNFRHTLTHLGKDLDESVKYLIDSYLQRLGRK